MQALDKKQVIRKNIASQKKLLSKDSALKRSQQICDRLEQTDIFQKSNCIAIYYAMDDEVQTSTLIEKWYEKKNIALPVISGENINFHKYTGIKHISTGKSGIAEPYNTEQIPPHDIDLFIVPGIAFDHNCNRIGRGKGYYDRYLSSINKPMIGICFDFQLIDSIPTEKHDIKMTMVITENHIDNIKKQY